MNLRTSFTMEPDSKASSTAPQSKVASNGHQAALKLPD